MTEFDYEDAINDLAGSTDTSGQISEPDMVFHATAYLPGSRELVAVFGTAPGATAYSLNYLRHPDNFQGASLATNRAISAGIHAIQSVRNRMAGHDSLPGFEQALKDAPATYRRVRGDEA